MKRAFRGFSLLIVAVTMAGAALKQPEMQKQMFELGSNWSPQGSGP
jgi:hypothetical protein